MSAFGGKADIVIHSVTSAFDQLRHGRLKIAAAQYVCLNGASPDGFAATVTAFAGLIDRRRRRLSLSVMTNKRECGKCSLCCKLAPIRELNKPIDTWCPHCRPGHGGCTIYSSRPSECRGFSCLWLSNPSGFGDEWFPARAKMVLVTPNENQILVMVDPDYPNAWRREPPQPGAY
jgi:hypothetical protein